MTVNIYGDVNGKADTYLCQAKIALQRNATDEETIERLRGSITDAAETIRSVLG